MITYSVCQAQRLITIAEAFRQKELLDSLFKQVEIRGKESQMCELNRGQSFLISSHFEQGNEISFHYKATGRRKGYFTKRIQSHQGIFHVSTLEFTF